MSSKEAYPVHWDIEVRTLSQMLERGMWAPNEISLIRRQIEDRKAQIVGGLGSATQIAWTLRVRTELDDDCRVRRDPIYGWMLDRWVEELCCWHPVGYIGTGGRMEPVSIIHPGQPATEIVVDDKVRPDLIPWLKSRDMQRPGYIEEKAEAAKAIREENEAKATEKVLAAVDSLSDARLKNFIEVEKAMQTGDTVTMHGETMKQFERLTEAGKKAPPGPESATPGLHPLRHKRDYSHGEGESYGERPN